MRPIISAVLTELLAILQFDLYLTLDQASAYTNLSRRFLENHLGEIRHLKVGRALRIRRSDLDEWLQEYVIEPKADNTKALIDDIVTQLIEQQEEN